MRYYLDVYEMFCSMKDKECCYWVYCKGLREVFSIIIVGCFKCSCIVY